MRSRNLKRRQRATSLAMSASAPTVSADDATILELRAGVESALASSAKPTQALPDEPKGFDPVAFAEDFQFAVSNPDTTVPEDEPEDFGIEPVEPDIGPDMDLLLDQYPDLAKTILEMNADIGESPTILDAEPEPAVAPEYIDLSGISARSATPSSEPRVELGFTTLHDPISADFGSATSPDGPLVADRDAMEMTPVPEAIGALAFPKMIASGALIFAIAEPIDEEALQALQSASALPIETEPMDVSEIVAAWRREAGLNPVPVAGSRETAAEPETSEEISPEAGDTVTEKPGLLSLLKNVLNKKRAA